MNWLRRRKLLGIKHPSKNGTTTESILREFVYLDESSVQSLLASQIGALPAEVTSMTERSFEAEGSASANINVPTVAKSDVTTRFKGSHTSGSQVLSRAVAETLFKKLYELTSERFVWRSSKPPVGPIRVQRGDLIEIEVELAPDPIFGFDTTMGILGDLAEDYPSFLEDPTTAMILREAGPVTKVLDRLLAGLIPLKALAPQLRAGVVNGDMVIASHGFFTAVPSMPVAVVGVTERDNYWRDVRRVLFSKTRFTVLGRVGRSDVQPSWVPVKLAEAMRDIAPEFPDTITRAGQVSYGKSVNLKQEENRDAMEAALVSYAIQLGGSAAAERGEELRAFARERRESADSIALQGEAFEDAVDWLVRQGVLDARPTDTRALRIKAREEAGLQASSAATTLSDFVSATNESPREAEALVDLEIIAIYW